MLFQILKIKRQIIMAWAHVGQFHHLMRLAFIVLAINAIWAVLHELN